MITAKAMAHRAIHELLDWMGLNVSYARTIRDPVKLLVNKAAELETRTILDVGANVGQFGSAIRKLGYAGAIVSFEPLSAAHNRLTKVASGDPAWYVAPRMALGEANGVSIINVSHNLASSSLLQVEQRSVTAAPLSGYCSTEEVPVNRLDEVIDPGWSGPYAMKLDTQGFELHVLRGAPNTLGRTKVVMVEMSLAPLYAGGASFLDVYRFFEDNGFRCITLTHGFADHERNELLQMDGVFVRDR